jgi:hypothetical protein
MDVDDQSVTRLVAATGCTPEQAHFFLEACGGNYDRSLSMYHGAHRGKRRPHRCVTITTP